MPELVLIVLQLSHLLTHIIILPELLFAEPERIPDPNGCRSDPSILILSYIVKKSIKHTWYFEASDINIFMILSTAGKKALL